MAMVTTGWSERPLSQPLGQRLPLQEPHYKVVNGAFVAHIVERADVGMLKLGDDLGFAFDAGAQFSACHQLRVQNFDRNRAVQSRVARTIHFAHSARAERRFDFVKGRPCARGQSHVSAQL
jgi:hypothetical protein